MTALHSLLLGARARTGTIALAIVALGAAGLHAERLPIQTYNTSNGLAHDRIRCIVPDSRGFLWFCTADGLSRFDGSLFVNYGPEQGLPNPSVEAIVEAAPGVYWVATVGGLARLRADPDRSAAVRSVARNAGNAPGHAPGTLPLTVYSLGSDTAVNHVLALKRDRGGRMWIGTAGGLFVMDQPLGEPRFRRVQPDSSTIPFGQVRAIAEGPDGTLWIGTLSGLFRRFPDGRIIRERSTAAADEVRRLLVDRKGRVWTSDGQALNVAVPATSPVSSSTSPTPATPRACHAVASNLRLPTVPGDVCRFETIARVPAKVRSLWEGSDGHVWIGTTDGLIEFEGERSHAYSERHGLQDETINAVAEDSAGNTWIGTDAGGVAKLTRTGLVSFRQADGLDHDYVTWISQNRAGRVRAGGKLPVLNEFVGERFTSGSFSIPGPVDMHGSHNVLEDHFGDAWVGTPRGLLRFPESTSVARLARARPKAHYSIADGLPAAYVAPVFEDSRGDVWMNAYFGSDGRVVRWQRSTGRFHQYPETDAQAGAVRDSVFAEDGAGTVWLGTTRGLARYRNGRFTPIGFGGDAKTIPVTALHVDRRGRLWIGTRGVGLYRSDDPTADAPHFTGYTVAQGLSSGTVWCLTADEAGHVYAGTPRGVDRLEPENGRFKHFSVADGLAGSEVITAFHDRGGALWFGTLTGISRLMPRPDVSHGPPPTVWIGGVRIGGVPQPLDLLGQSHVFLPTLAPHQNQVQIDYFGLSPATGDHLTYQYQFEGPTSEWAAPTAERAVNYPELAPGSYRFLVRAVNEDGQVSQAPASVTFTIVPPVWKRGWFLSTLTLLATASGYALHKSRLVRLLEMERLRTRIASDLHDDLGSSLSQISILSEIVRAHLGNPEARIADPLSRIGTLSRESVDSMGDIVWAIDPLRDTPIHLLQRMRRVAKELLGAAGVQLRFDSSGDASPHLDAEVRRHVFLIFKEILNNIVRHADATTVTVAVIVASRELHLRVTDDGRGFDVAVHSEGQGLRSMQRRASSLGGSMEVTSASGGGTRVTLTLPVR